MPKAPANPAPKADWEIAIEKLAAMTAEDKAEAKIRISKVDEAMARLSRHFDTELAEEGETLEDNVAAAIVKDLSLGRVKFDNVITNAHAHGKYGDGEFDWIGINGKITMVGETKRTLKRDDVRRFALDRMGLFRLAFPHYIKGKELQGVLIYQKANKGAVEEALKLRMLVFRAEDDKTLHPVKTPPKRNQTKTHKRPRKSAA